jgi:hypothetical protein
MAAPLRAGRTPRAQADEHCSRAAWWREETRAVREETERMVARARELVAASRRQRQERADAENR